MYDQAINHKNLVNIPGNTAFKPGSHMPLQCLRCRSRYAWDRWESIAVSANDDLAGIPEAYENQALLTDPAGRNYKPLIQ